MPTNAVLGVKPGTNAQPLLDLAQAVLDPPADIHLVSLIRVGTDADERERLERTRRGLAATAEALEGKGYRTHVTAQVAGVAPGGELVQIADRVGADLIVIGLAKRSRVGKALLGSDAQRVLLSASCPVLSTRIA